MLKAFAACLSKTARARWFTLSATSRTADTTVILGRSTMARDIQQPWSPLYETEPIVSLCIRCFEATFHIGFVTNPRVLYQIHFGPESISLPTGFNILSSHLSSGQDRGIRLTHRILQGWGFLLLMKVCSVFALPWCFLCTMTARQTPSNLRKRFSISFGRSYLLHLESLVVVFSKHQKYISRT